jgi:diguanylate cyclase (GGDEF)-like protein
LHLSVDHALDQPDIGLMRRVATAEFLAGGITLFLVLLAPDPDKTDHAAVAIVGGLILLAAALLGACRRPRLWMVRLAPLYATATISAIVAVSDPIAGTPFFYLWPLLYTAYFLPRRDVALGFLFFAVSFGVCLVWSAPGTRLMVFQDTVSSVALVTVLVVLLKERVVTLIEQLQVTASTDSLTGLLNRRAFESAFEREVERAARSGLRVSLVLFDVDWFKQVNDRLGHAAGDRALRRIATLLAREGRSADVIARIGGEEFAVVLFDVDEHGAGAFAERVLAVVAKETAEDELPLSLSAGVAGASRDSEQLFLAADRALYRAKDLGRGRVEVCIDEPPLAKPADRM